MPQITPEEMQAAEAKYKSTKQNIASEGQEPSGGDVTKMVQGIGQWIQALQQIVAQSPGVTEEDIAQLDQIMSLYSDFVEKSLGAAPGENPEPEMEPEQKGPVPMQQGRGGQPMGPQSRQ